VRRITAIIIVLFSIGVISAALVGYNYFVGVHVISKQQAVDLATKYCQCISQKVGNYTIEAKLLQAKLSNHISLLINDSTMSVSQALPQVYSLPRFNFQEDQLFWNITMVTHVKGETYHEWQYYIDATNGTLLTSENYDMQRCCL